MPKKGRGQDDSAEADNSKNELPLRDQPRSIQNGIEVSLDSPIMGCRVLEFCVHSLERMNQRGISQTDVIQALRTPTKRNLRADPPKQRIAWRKSDKTEIHVVFLRQPPKLVVVTAYVPD